MVVVTIKLLKPTKINPTVVVNILNSAAVTTQLMKPRLIIMDLTVVFPLLSKKPVLTVLMVVVLMVLLIETKLMTTVPVNHLNLDVVKMLSLLKQIMLVLIVDVNIHYMDVVQIRLQLDKPLNLV